MKFAIYSRKSKFTGKGESIENQIELCRQYIATHFSDIDVDDVIIYEDEGFSGGNTERPKFKLMMSDAKDKKFSAIICYRLDRISRNIGDFAKLIEELNDLEISFISIKEQFDTSSPMGRAMMYIASVFSQLERETIAERIRDNMHELAKTGRWLGGNTPTGYKSEQIEKITLDGKVRKACKLGLIKEEAELVKLIFNKFIETNSLTMVETYLMQNHIQTKNENEFTRFSVRSILKNPVYMIADEEAWKYFQEQEAEVFATQSDFDGKHGVMAYNKTLQRTGKTNEIRDINQWIIAVGKHRGIVSGKDWVRAQEMLAQNNSKAYRKPKSNVALLTGLLFCGDCDSYMRPKQSGSINSEGEKIYSYLCETKEKSRMHNCNMKNPNGNALDNAVCEEIKKLSENSFEFIKQLKVAEKIIKSDTKVNDIELIEFQKKINSNENEINSLVGALQNTKGTPASDYITKQINKLHEKTLSIKRRMEELSSFAENNIFSELEIDLIKTMFVSFGETFEKMDVKQKRDALHMLIRKIEWDGESANVYLFGSYENN